PCVSENVSVAATLTFSLTQGPVGAAIDGASGQFTFVPQWNQVGNHVVTVRVTDDSGAYQERSFTIAVNNQTPVLDALPDRAGHPGSELRFHANAIDPDGDPVQYSLTSAPVGAFIDADSGLFTWTPQWNQLGANVVTVRATDPGNLYQERQFTVTVTDQPPVIDTPPNRTGHPDREVFFYINAFDPEA